ncbi:MAG: tetratricopeptide repeat protein [Spirochaetales bacterium]|nr:tetratricopeptide repeat protein [Spirochaetales bacterium]
MTKDIDPLKNIVFLSIPENMNGLDVLPIDPSILLPVEIDPARGVSDIANLSWEMIIAAILKIFAHNPEHKDAEYYRKLVNALRPDLLNEMTNAAIVKVNEKDFDISEEIFKALINFAPDKSISHLNLALLYEQRADTYSEINKTDLANEYYDKAFEKYKEILKIENVTEEFFYNFGIFLLKRNNIDKAEELLSIYIERSSDSKKVKYVKSVIEQIKTKKNKDELFFSAFDYIKMEKEDEAIKNITEYLKTEPEVWNAWFLLGWAYRRKQEYTEAVKAFEKALDLGSEETDLYNEMAICLMELGKLEESRDFLLKANKKEPENIKILSNLGILFFKKEDYTTSERYFKKVLSITADDKIALEYLAKIDNL